MGTEMKTENDAQSGLKAAFVMPKLTADWMVSLSSSGCVASRILVCVVGATRFDLEEHQIVVVGWWRLKGSAFSTWFVPKRLHQCRRSLPLGTPLLRLGTCRHAVVAASLTDVTTRRMGHELIIPHQSSRAARQHYSTGRWLRRRVRCRHA